MPSPVIAIHASRTALVLSILTATSLALINQLQKAASGTTMYLTYRDGTSSTFIVTSYDSTLSTAGYIGNAWPSLYDESIYPDFSNGGCLSYTFLASSTLPAELLFDIHLGSTVSARSFVSFVTRYTQNQAFFQDSTLTLNLWLGSTQLQSFTAKGANAVWTTGSLISFNRLELLTTTSIAYPGTSISFCVDSIFAILEHYLNPYSLPSDQIWVNYDATTVYWQAFNAVQYTPLESTFTQSSKCPDLTNNFVGGGSATGFLPSFNTSPFQFPYSNPSIMTDARLVTSVFWQVGGNTLPSLTLAIRYWAYSGGAWTINTSLSFYTGSGFLDLQASGTSKYYATQVGVQTNTRSIWICALQYFGYPYCYFTSAVLTPVTTTKIQAGSPSIQIALNQIVAYYDVENKFWDNNFCSIGLQIQVYLNGTLQSQLVFSAGDAHFALTQLLTFTSTATSAQDTLMSVVISDSRNPSTTAFTAHLTIQEYWCNQALLNQARITLSDGSEVRDQNYVINSGATQSISYADNKSCNGLSATLFMSLIQVVDSVQTYFAVNQDQNSFTQCKLTNNEMCFLFNPEDRVVQYYSNDLTETSQLLRLKAIFQYTDTNDAVFNQVQTVDQILTKTRNCELTIFTPTLVSNSTIAEGLYIFTVPSSLSAVLEFQGEFTVFIFGKENQSDGMSFCGGRTFSLTANISDTNFQLANDLLLNCQDCLQFQVSPDNYRFAVKVQPQQTKYAGFKLQFTLTVGLVMFATQNIQNDPRQEFPLILTFQNSIMPSKAHFYANYTIGVANAPIFLPTYDISPAKYLIKSMTVKQISGKTTLDPTSYYVDSQNKTFQMKIYDMSLNGTQVSFQFTATLNSLQQDSDSTLVLTIFIGAASPSEALKFNTLPTFASGLPTPDELPCLNQNSALRWSYQLPVAVDDEGNEIQFGLKCPILSSKIFLVKVSFDILTLTLSQNAQFQPLSGTYTCNLILTDSNKAQSQYDLNFTTACRQSDSLVQNSQKSQNSTNKLIQPIPSIRSISNSGLVTLQWNVDIYLPQNSSQDASEKTLKSDNCYLESPLSAKIVSLNNSTTKNDFDFTFIVSEFRVRETIFQINFTTPQAISVRSNPESLVFVIKNPSCFVSVQNISVSQEVQLQANLPRQNTQGVFQIPASLQSIVQGVIYLTAAALVLNFFLAAFLNQLLSLISSLSLLMHMFLISLNYPVQIMNFFGTIFPLIAFDILPTAVPYEAMFHFAEIQTDYALSNQFSIVGYTSIFLVNNIGSIYLMIVLGLASILPLWLVRHYKVFKCSKMIQQRVDNITNGFLWQGVTQFCVQNYLVISVTSFIASNDIRVLPQYSPTEKYCSYMAIYGMIFAFGFPLAMIFLYKLKFNSYRSSRVQAVLMRKMNKADLNERFWGLLIFNTQSYRQFLESYGVMLIGIKIEEVGVNIAIFTSIIEQLFQLIVAVGVTRLVHYPSFVTFCFNFTILFHLCFTLYFLPYRDQWKQTRVIVNDLTYLLLNYHLFLFTNFVDSSMYSYIANSCLCIITLNVGFNFLIGVAQVLTPAHYKLRLVQRRSVYRKKQKRTDKDAEIVAGLSQLPRQKAQGNPQQPQKFVGCGKDKKSNLKKNSVLVLTQIKTVSFAPTKNETQLIAEGPPIEMPLVKQVFESQKPVPYKSQMPSNAPGMNANNQKSRLKNLAIEDTIIQNEVVKVNYSAKIVQTAKQTQMQPLKQSRLKAGEIKTGIKIDQSVQKQSQSPHSNRHDAEKGLNTFNAQNSIPYTNLKDPKIINQVLDDANHPGWRKRITSVEEATAVYDQLVAREAKLRRPSTPEEVIKPVSLDQSTSRQLQYTPTELQQQQQYLSVLKAYRKTFPAEPERPNDISLPEWATHLERAQHSLLQELWSKQYKPKYYDTIR